MLPVNPPGHQLGRENAVLSGRGARYHVPDFEGCLSLKSVVEGTAAWESDKRRFALHEDCWLILNDRQRYTITIESVRPVTTFCLFFERGFVEELHRARVTPSQTLLDSPRPFRTEAIEFYNRIEPPGDRVAEALQRFRADLNADGMSRIEWDQHFLKVAELLVDGRSDTAHAVARLPALRNATRLELFGACCEPAISCIPPSISP